MRKPSPGARKDAKERVTPRPGILDIAPYVGGESELPGIAKPIKLASNESPFLHSGLGWELLWPRQT